jgi:hypothetical protein
VLDHGASQHRRRPAAVPHADISPRSGDAHYRRHAENQTRIELLTDRRRIAVAQQQTYVGPDRPTYPDEAAGGGWITFAGVMLILVSILNIIDGIAAISDSKFFVANAEYVFSNLNTWGWIVLGIGVLQMLVAFGIWAGSQMARWAGLVIVSLNAIAQLLFIPAYPFWSLSIFTIDILIIYGLAAYGGRPALD